MQASKAQVDLSINFSWLIRNYFNSFQAMHKKPDLSKRAWVIKLCIPFYTKTCSQYTTAPKLWKKTRKNSGCLQSNETHQKKKKKKKKNMTKNDLTLNYSNLIHLSTKYSRKYSPDNITATHLYSKLPELTFFDQLLTTLLPSFHNIKKIKYKSIFKTTK